MAKCLLTEQLIKAYCEEIKLGNVMELAARSIGVAPRTVRSWLERGRRWLETGRKPQARTDILCRQLADEFRKAESSLASRHIANITRKALDPKGPWQASAWMLERRWPEHFGNRLEVRGKVDVMTICGQDLTKDELGKFSKLLDPLLGILREEIKDPALLERIGDRIQSVYSDGQ